MMDERERKVGRDGKAPLGASLQAAKNKGRQYNCATAAWEKGGESAAQGWEEDAQADE